MLLLRSGFVLRSVQFSCSVVSNSLQPHGLQHARLPCPSPTLGGCSNSCPLSQWCHPTISSSVIPFSSFSIPQFIPGIVNWDRCFLILIALNLLVLIWKKKSVYQSIHGEGNGNPLQCSCLENPIDRGAWRPTVNGVARVEHDLAMKPPPSPKYTVNSLRQELSFFTILDF